MTVCLDLQTGERVKAIVEDLSKSGFRLRSSALLHPAQKLRMKLPKETLACEVRWVDGLEAGGVFTESLEVPSW
jgi:hypothetical protein